MSQKYAMFLDSCMGAISIGFAPMNGDERDVRATSFFETCERGQAERLVPFIEVCLQSAALTYSDLEALIVTCGPGRFTGVRVGLTAMQSLAMVLNVPLYGLSVFQALALGYVQEVGPDKPIAVLIESKRADFFVQTFDCYAEPACGPQALSADEIAALLKQDDYRLIGDGVERFKACHHDYSFVDYQRIPAGMVGDLICRDGFSKPYLEKDPKPLYLRGADVSSPKNKPRALEA